MKRNTLLRLKRLKAYLQQATQKRKNVLIFSALLLNADIALTQEIIANTIDYETIKNNVRYRGINDSPHIMNIVALPWGFGVSSDKLNYSVPSGSSHVFYVNHAEQMRINNNGNVGIGTTAPAQKLDVSGTIKSEKLYLNNLDAGATTDKILVVGDDKFVRTINAITGTNIYNSDGTITGVTGGNRTVTMGNNNLLFSSGNGNFIFNPTGTGKVGIGTTNPSELLDIQPRSGSGNNNFIRLQTSASNGTTAGILFNEYNTPYGWRMRFDAGNDNFYLEAISITNTIDRIPFIVERASGNVAFSGNIGLGTHVPYEKLDILGSIYLTNHGSSNQHDASEKGIRRIGQKAGGNADGFNGLEFEVRHSPALQYQNAGLIKFYTWGAGISTTREVARIDPFGRLGIGTTTPTELLDVNGTIKSEKLFLNSVDAGATTDNYLVLGNDKFVRTVAAVTNIYNGDGSLTGARTINNNNNNLVFSNVSTAGGSGPGGVVFSGSVSNTGATFINTTTKAKLQIMMPNSGGTDIWIQASKNNSTGVNVLCIKPQEGVIFMGRNDKFSNLQARVGINAENPTTHLQVLNATCDGYTWNNASDIRLKKDIVSNTYGLQEVLQLNPKFYTYKNNKLGKREVGFIAQEVMAIIPEVVHGKEGDLDKGEILTLNYANITAILTAAIQEQQAHIEEEKNKVKNLQEELNKIKQIINTLFSEDKTCLKDDI